MEYWEVIGMSSEVQNYIQQLTVKKTRFEEYQKQNTVAINNFKAVIGEVDVETRVFLKDKFGVDIEGLANLDLENITADELKVIQQDAREQFKTLRAEADKLLAGE